MPKKLETPAFEAEIRLPTIEYGYINVKVKGSFEEIILAHNELGLLYKGLGGLPQKEWNRVLDKYLNQGGMLTDEGAQMSDRQKWMIHELDKAFARISRHDIIISNE